MQRHLGWTFVLQTRQLFGLIDELHYAVVVSIALIMTLPWFYYAREASHEPGTTTNLVQASVPIYMQRCSAGV